MLLVYYRPNCFRQIEPIRVYSLGEAMDKILERIVRDAGIPDLVSILAERLPPTDLQSVLLEVYRVRSGRIQPADLLSDFASNRFV